MDMGYNCMILGYVIHFLRYNKGTITKAVHSSCEVNCLDNLNPLLDQKKFFLKAIVSSTTLNRQYK